MLFYLSNFGVTEVIGFGVYEGDYIGGSLRTISDARRFDLAFLFFLFNDLGFTFIVTRLFEAYEF